MVPKIRNPISAFRPGDLERGTRWDVNSVAPSRIVDVRVDEVFKKRPRSSADLSLIPKSKKIKESKRLAHLDLVSKINSTQKDLGASLAFRKSMDIIAITGLIHSRSLDASDSISLKRAKKTDEVFAKRRIESNTIYMSKVEGEQDVALLKQKSTWGKYRVVSGGYKFALISDSEVLKIGKGSCRYEKEQDRLNTIYSRIGNSSIGIQKRMIDPIKSPNLFRSSSSNRERLPIKYHREYPYKKDLYDLIISGSVGTPERMKIYNSLVSGSKILIQNGIYHLDAKLENMGYLGDGRVEHFDFGGAFIFDKDEGKINSEGYAVSSATLSKDCKTLDELLKRSDTIKAVSLLEKVHIFQLGIAFFGLSTGRNPYLGGGGCYIDTLHSEEVLRKTIESQKEPDEPKHRAMILKMLSEKAEDRPNIDEVELAFQEAPLTSSFITSS